jgi:hypothetical protein
MSNKAITLITWPYLFLNTSVYSYFKHFFSHVALYSVLYHIRHANNWLQ